MSGLHRVGSGHKPRRSEERGERPPKTELPISFRIQLVPDTLKPGSPASKGRQRGTGQTILWLGQECPTPDEWEVLHLIIGPGAKLEMNPVQGSVRQHFLKFIDEPEEGLHPVLPCQERHFRPSFQFFVDGLCGQRARCNFLVKRNNWPIEFYYVDGISPQICLRWNEPRVLVEEMVIVEGGRRFLQRKIIRTFNPGFFLTHSPWGSSRLDQTEAEA